jgi:GTP-binding protein
MRCGVLRDEVKINVRAGNGGAGSLHFRREKYVPRGGPDGGDGGRGGSVYVEADRSLNTLYRYVRNRHFAAEPGGAGAGRRKHGKAGADITLAVPPGTVVRDADTGEALADLTEPGARVMVARGGRGGLGNTHFATATRQAPRIAEKGEPGEERWLLLELKLIADVGIVGLPNAGKSTLLSHISAARPKIADYPFTTLSPNLGVVAVDEDRLFVAADIPGLIEGAHSGAGLGHEFLRHVERTAVFIHLLDGAAGDAAAVVRAFDTINNELELYQEGLSRRPMVVAVNKMDLPDAQENLPGVRRALERRGFRVHAISGATGEGLGPLLEDVWARLEEARAELAARPREEPVMAIEPVDQVGVEPVEGGFRVHSRRAERAVAMTDTEQPEAMDRLEELLRRFGVTTALERAGVEPGDAVYIGDLMLTWGE